MQNSNEDLKDDVEMIAGQIKNISSPPVLTAKYLRHRKMMLVLPLLVLPFVTLAFWALVLEKKSTDSKDADVKNGLNMELPGSNMKEDKTADKLSFYKAADADSIKRREIMRNDPYYKDSLTQASLPANLYSQNTMPAQGVRQLPYNSSTTNNVQKIYQKIKEINQQIDQSADGEKSYKNNVNPGSANNSTEQFTNQVDRLQNMMQQMHGNGETDPEMEQLNGTLEKIMDIQHPERVQQKIKENAIQSKEQVFLVSKNSLANNISLLDTGVVHAQTQYKFYSLEQSLEQEDQQTIEAVVHQTQTLVNGAVIKLRLLNDIYVNGNVIPKDNFIYGLARLNEERLEVSINSIRNKSGLYPVRLEVFDMDGLQGIYIPGAITRVVAKQSADNSLQFLGMSSLDPSLKAQVAAGGIGAAKSLLSKKIKLVKVVVKAGYRILLKDKTIQP